MDDDTLREDDTENKDSELDVDDETFIAQEAVPLNPPSYFKKSESELVLE